MSIATPKLREYSEPALGADRRSCGRRGWDPPPSSLAFRDGILSFAYQIPGERQDLLLRRSCGDRRKPLWSPGEASVDLPTSWAKRRKVCGDCHSSSAKRSRLEHAVASRPTDRTTDACGSGEIDQELYTGELQHLLQGSTRARDRCGTLDDAEYQRVLLLYLAFLSL